jgi:hypothetical protein
MDRTNDVHTRQTRQAALAFIVAAAATALAGAVLFLILQPTTDLSDDMWRYPWESSGAFVAFTIFSTLLHALVIVGLRAFGRSGVAGTSRAARSGLVLVLVGTALLLVGELASIPVRDGLNDDTNVGIVGAIFGFGGIASTIGFLLIGWATVRAGRWQGWRRFTPIATGIWMTAMNFIGIAAPTSLHGMVGVYGLCLLSIAVALYTQPAPTAPAAPARFAPLAVE